MTDSTITIDWPCGGDIDCPCPTCAELDAAIANARTDAALFNDDLAEVAVKAVTWMHGEEMKPISCRVSVGDFQYDIWRSGYITLVGV
jgi:hypothetical protein